MADLVLEPVIEAGDWPEVASTALVAPVARALAAATGARGVAAIVFADDALLRDLNARYRGKDKPTNVLSFVDGGEEPDGTRRLGDVVIALETVIREAAEAGRPLADHVAHMIVHGVLHLLGHDHEAEAEAAAMERLETDILARLGVADPYGEAAPAA